MLAWVEPAQPEVPSYGAQLVQTLIALVVVCILAYVILRWGLARFMGPRTKHGPMEILARIALDGRQGLLVVRVANRVFLLGTGGNAPSFLAELDPDHWSDEMARWTDAKGPSLFQRVLQGINQSQPNPRLGSNEPDGIEGHPSQGKQTHDEASRDGDDATDREG